MNEDPEEGEWPSQQEMEWMDSHPEMFLPQTSEELQEMLEEAGTKAWFVYRLAEHLVDHGGWQSLYRLCHKDLLCRMIGIKLLLEKLSASLGSELLMEAPLVMSGDSSEPQTCSYILLRVRPHSEPLHMHRSRVWIYDPQRNSLFVQSDLLVLLRELISFSAPSRQEDNNNNKIQLVSINSDVLPFVLPEDTAEPEEDKHRGGWSNGGGSTSNVSLWRVSKKQFDVCGGGLLLKRIARSDELPTPTTAIFIPQKWLKFCITYSFGELGPIPATKCKSASTRHAWSDNYLRHAQLMWNTIFQPAWRVQRETVVVLACNTLPIQSSNESGQIRRWFHDAWQVCNQCESSTGSAKAGPEEGLSNSNCLLLKTLERARGDMLVCIRGKNSQPSNQFLIMRNRALGVSMTPELLAASMMVSNTLEETLWPNSELLAKGYTDAELRAGDVISYPCSSSAPAQPTPSFVPPVHWGKVRYLCWSDPSDPRQGQYAIFMVRDHLKTWNLWHLRLISTIQGSQEMLDLGGMREASELRDYFLHEKRQGQWGAFEKTCFMVPERCTDNPHWHSFYHFDGVRDWITQRYEESCQPQLKRSLISVVLS